MSNRYCIRYTNSDFLVAICQSEEEAVGYLQLNPGFINSTQIIYPGGLQVPAKKFRELRALV